MKTVADIMTSMPIVATVPGSRNDAINLMVRNKLTGVPVVRESDGQLMGIVSRRDVFNNMNEEQLSMLMKKNHSPLIIIFVPSVNRAVSRFSIFIPTILHACAKTTLKETSFSGVVVIVKTYFFPFTRPSIMLTS